jgi:quercetin dioxygenase-like cupin family protein
MTYSHGNLKELEDSAPKFGMPPGIEARFGRQALGCEQQGFSYQRYAPGFRTFAHRHKVQEEIVVILSGGGRMKIDDDILPLTQWDVIRIAAGTTRALEAGPDGVEFLVFGAPATPPGDGEIFEDWWPAD